jgi:cation:H+ antiporter
MLEALSLPWILVLFAGLSAVIALTGVRLVRVADQLADATGLGEALFGAVLLGGVTSLAGIVASVSASWAGDPELSVSNAIGGIAAQTVFLAIADRFHPHANLEHAAASLENIMMGVLLGGQLAWVLLLMYAPPLEFFHLHVGSLVLLAFYGFGLRFVARAKQTPMWRPRQTKQTVPDEPVKIVLGRRQLLRRWAVFFVLAAVVGLAGYGVAQSGIQLAARSGLSSSFVGALFTAVSTSLPELVVAISAARLGSLTMAVSNVVGGNAFDVLFVAFADIAYRGGSIFHAIPERTSFVVVLTMLMTSVLVFGMLYRERYGPGRIGWESLLLLSFFLLGYGVLAML